jgi:hypothetical protein
MKVDLGGWLSHSGLVLRLGRSLSEPILRAWLEPMLLSVVILRDKVEQSRFVVRPYSIGDAVEEEPEETEPSETPRPVHRTVGRCGRGGGGVARALLAVVAQCWCGGQHSDGVVLAE